MANLEGDTPPADRFFLCYNQARDEVAAKNFRNKGEYKAWSSTERLRCIPGAPDMVYKGIGWRGWNDWLGKESPNPPTIPTISEAVPGEGGASRRVGEGGRRGRGEAEGEGVGGDEAEADPLPAAPPSLAMAMESSVTAGAVVADSSTALPHTPSILGERCVEPVGARAGGGEGGASRGVEEAGSRGRGGGRGGRRGRGGGRGGRRGRGEVEASPHRRARKPLFSNSGHGPEAGMSRIHPKTTQRDKKAIKDVMTGDSERDVAALRAMAKDPETRELIEEAFPSANTGHTVIAANLAQHVQSMGSSTRTNNGRMHTTALLCPFMEGLGRGEATKVARTLGYASVGPLRRVAKRARGDANCSDETRSTAEQNAEKEARYVHACERCGKRYARHGYMMNHQSKCGDVGGANVESAAARPETPRTLPSVGALTKRARRSDATSPERLAACVSHWVANTRVSTAARDFISRPKGVKTDPEGKATKQYLECTLLEMYDLYEESVPDPVCKRIFDQQKPWYVYKVRPCDRVTCQCRKHVESVNLFGALYRLGTTAMHAHDMRPVRVRRAAAEGAVAATAAAGARVGGGAIGGAGGAAAMEAERATALDVITPLIESRGSLRKFTDAMLCPKSPAAVALTQTAPSTRRSNRINREQPTTTPRLVDKGWAPLACHEGKCSSCGVHKVGPLLDALILLAPPDAMVSWHSYDYMETSGKRRLEQVRKGPMTPKDFKEEVLTDMFGRVYKKAGSGRQYRAGFVWHSFEAAWQAAAMAHDKETFPPGTIWMGTDFAQNATIRLQNETATEYFNAKQVTIYNLVVFYHAEESTVANRVVKKLYMHVLSDDMTHDQESVHVFHAAVWGELKRLGIRQERWHWWSDGGPAHFKSSAAYADLTRYAVEFEGLVLMRAFGATSHMKGEWDGSGTFVKASVDSHLLKPGKIISTAEEYFKWCDANLSETRALKKNEHKSKALKVTLTGRRFLYVPADSIPRGIKRREKIEGVHAVHQIFPGTPPQHALMARSLSCFCRVCRGDRESRASRSQSMTSSAPPSDVCENAAWCTAPTPITIKNFSSSSDVLHSTCNGDGAPATANAGPNEEETDEPETEEVEADVGGVWEEFVEEEGVERDLVGWEGNEDGYEPFIISSLETGGGGSGCRPAPTGPQIHRPGAGSDR